MRGSPHAHPPRPAERQQTPRAARRHDRRYRSLDSHGRSRSIRPGGGGVISRCGCCGRCTLQSRQQRQYVRCAIAGSTAFATALKVIHRLQMPLSARCRREKAAVCDANFLAFTNGRQCAYSHRPEIGGLPHEIGVGHAAMVQRDSERGPHALANRLPSRRVHHIKAIAPQHGRQARQMRTALPGACQETQPNCVRKRERVLHVNVAKFVKVTHQLVKGVNCVAERLAHRTRKHVVLAFTSVSLKVRQAYEQPRCAAVSNVMTTAELAGQLPQVSKRHTFTAHVLLRPCVPAVTAHPASAHARRTVGAHGRQACRAARVHRRVGRNASKRQRPEDDGTGCNVLCCHELSAARAMANQPHREGPRVMVRHPIGGSALCMGRNG